MSLINEALKRTRDASYQSASSPTAGAPDYRVEPVAGASSFGAKSAGAAMVFVLVIATGAASFYAIQTLARMKTVKDQLVSVAQPPDVGAAQAVGVSTPASKTSPASQQQVTVQPPSQVEPKPAGGATAGGTEKTEVKSTEDQLVAQVLEKLKAQQAVESAPVQAPPPEPPKLVLQGITRQGQTSEVMINGYTLREGEDIEGARVIAIDARTVKMQFGGRDFVLRMP